MANAELSAPSSKYERVRPRLIGIILPEISISLQNSLRPSEVGLDLSEFRDSLVALLRPTDTGFLRRTEPKERVLLISRAFLDKAALFRAGEQEARRHKSAKGICIEAILGHPIIKSW